MFIVDCDCHNYWSSATVLEPYLSGVWKDMFIHGERTGPEGAFPHGHRPWFHPHGFSRKDIRPLAEDDHYAIMKEKHLDPNKIDVAILTGDEPMEASTLANPYYAIALVSAYNDYQIDYWLKKDSRFMGSIVIAPQDPQMAAKEIRRLGHHPRMAQVLASHGSVKPYGDPFYHPIYEACAEVGLPFAIHLGGQGGINWNAIAPAPTTFFWETLAILHMSALAHVASMIAHGVFEKWPELYFVVIECGVAWVPSVLWRLDQDYKALHKETPWLKRCCHRNMHAATSASPRSRSNGRTICSICGASSRRWTARTRCSSPPTIRTVTMTTSIHFTCRRSGSPASSGSTRSRSTSASRDRVR
jgi:uncharacterized protein